MMARCGKTYNAIMNQPKRFVLLMLVSAVIGLVVTTGCQTSKGFGKDVENLGDKIQEKSK